MINVYRVDYLQQIKLKIKKQKLEYNNNERRDVMVFLYNPFLVLYSIINNINLLFFSTIFPQKCREIIISFWKILISFEVVSLLDMKFTLQNQKLFKLIFILARGTFLLPIVQRVRNIFTLVWKFLSIAEYTVLNQSIIG